MKKITALFMALVILLSLTACGGGSDTTAGTTGGGEGVENTGSGSGELEYLREMIPESLEVDLNSGIWKEYGSYGALILSGEAEYNFSVYQEALYEAGFTETDSCSQETEDSYGVMADYFHPELNCSIRIIYNMMTDTFAIVAAEELPTQSACWKLVDGSIDSEQGGSQQGGSQQGGSNQGDAATDSPLYAMIPKTPKFDYSTGTWIEKNGYGALVFTGISESYDYDIWDDLKAAGFSGGSGYGYDAVGGKMQDYRNLDLNCMLRTVYCGQTDTFAIVVGQELPMRYICWQMMGLTEEDIGKPYFEGKVYDYIPDPQSIIYLYYTESGHHDGQYQYQVCEVDRTRLEKYIAMVTEGGYVETCREEPDGESMYYEANLKVYEEFDIYLTVQLAWYHDKLMIVYSESDAVMDKEAVWEGAKTYTGDKNGKDPNAPPEEGYQPLDLSAATRVETVGGQTIYYFEGEYTVVESARLYIDQLCDQGYKDEKMPYVPDVMPYQVEYAHNWLVNESMGDQSYVIVVAWSKMAMVITSAQELAYREHDLWDMVGCYMPFGLGYLETVYREFCYDHGVMGIAGEGWSSSGYFSNYGYDCDMESVNWMIGELETEGFTEYGTTTENGTQVWVFCRTDEYQLLSTTIYARVLLDGDFGEVEFGYGFRTHSENMG